ncbi:MAG: CRISPR-associated helicase/endonuclease Cas3, partial [Candidatus Electrothrix sp. EH2]|nr:CRISPR-associated helicase/endonuclease Cas3 [Candidatus Electrothrix sp. EH2]
FSEKLLEPECIQAYFADYFWKNQHRMDEDSILECCRAGTQRAEFAFEDIAEFRMIDNANQAITIARDDEAAELVRQLEYVEFPKTILRQLQRYSVQVYPNQFRELKEKGWLERPVPGLGVHVLQKENAKSLYSDKTGLQCRTPDGQSLPRRGMD